MDSYVRLDFKLYEPPSFLLEMGMVSNFNIEFIGDFVDDPDIRRGDFLTIS